MGAPQRLNGEQFSATKFPKRANRNTVHDDRDWAVVLNFGRIVRGTEDTGDPGKASGFSR